MNSPLSGAGQVSNTAHQTPRKLRHVTALTDSLAEWRAQKKPKLYIYH